MKNKVYYFVYHIVQVKGNNPYKTQKVLHPEGHKTFIQYQL